MNITELEEKYGSLPSNLDRKKMETLLKKSINPNPLLEGTLIYNVQAWLKSANLTWSVESIPYHFLDGSLHNLQGLWIENTIMLVLVDDYLTFNKKVVHKGIAGKIHKELLDQGKRVIWCKKFEWETPRKREVMKSAIIHALGKTAKKFYARNTICEIVESKSLASFWNENSFYGNRNAAQAIVLKDKKTGEILQAANFGHSFYGKTKYGGNYVECIRSAGKRGCTIVGGMSKLMKFFIQNCCQDIDKILFYSDMSHHQSTSMDAAGFKLESISGNAVHNVWVETGMAFNRTPALHKEIKYLQQLGIIVGVPDVGSESFTLDVKEFLHKAEE